MEMKHTLIFKNEKYSFSVDFTRGIEVQLEVFQDFLEYWQNSKEPKINYENIYEYYLLSKEFCLMTEYFSEKTNESNFHMASLKYLSNHYKNNEQNALDKTIEERFISMHLDSYLDNNEDQLLEISIQSLYNIFFNKD